MSSKRSTWKNTRTFYAVIRFPRFSSKDIFLGEAKIQTYEFQSSSKVHASLSKQGSSRVQVKFKRGSSGVQRGSRGVQAGFKWGSSGVQAGYKLGSS